MRITVKEVAESMQPLNQDIWVDGPSSWKASLEFMVCDVEESLKLIEPCSVKRGLNALAKSIDPGFTFHQPFLRTFLVLFSVTFYI